MLRGAHVGHRPAADDVGHPVGHQRPAHDQQAGRARSADELVRGEDHGVLGRGRVAVGRHVDVDIGPAGGVVPEGQCAVRVQQPRDPNGVRQDPGHVRRRAERADLQRTVGMAHQLVGKPIGIDVAVGALRDQHHIGDRLPPGQLVAVVLERADEHHRARLGRDLGAETVAVVEVGGDAQVQDPDELVDGSRAAGPGEDHGGRVVTVDAFADDPPGILAQPGGLQAGAAGLGVRVGVAGQHLVADHVLEEVQGAAAGRVIGVGDPAPAIGALHDLVVADHATTDPAQQRRLGQSGRGRRDLDHRGSSLDSAWTSRSWW